MGFSMQREKARGDTAIHTHTATRHEHCGVVLTVEQFAEAIGATVEVYRVIETGELHVEQTGADGTPFHRRDFITGSEVTA